MDFIGRDGWPAPLLKNTTLSTEVGFIEQCFFSFQFFVHFLFLPFQKVAYQSVSNIQILTVSISVSIEMF